MTRKIILADNSIAAGYLEGEPINFNWQEYQLHSPSGKIIGGMRKRFRFHIFNYLGIIAGDYLAGIAAVSLGYADNVFAYLIHPKKGSIFEYASIVPTLIRPSRLYDSHQPDHYSISYRKKNAAFEISKDARKSLLSVQADINDALILDARFEYDMKRHHPLRVADSSGLGNWGFTEKCPLARAQEISLSFEGKGIDARPDNTFLIYDFSAGFMHRHTEWFWTAFSGRDERSGELVGGNFATNNNYPLYSENGLWIGKKRYYFFNNIAYSFRKNDPSREWSIFTVDEKGRPDRKLELTFEPGRAPAFLREENINMRFISSKFSQFFGRISGSYRDGRKKMRFSNIYAISETHSTDW